MKKIFVVLFVALLTLSSISVMAQTSPSADKLHKITVAGENVKKNGGTIKVDGGSIIVSKGFVKDGKKVTLKAKPNKGKKFSKWDIDGDFTIVSGSLTSDTIVIIPNGDIDVDAEFDSVKKGSGDGEKPFSQEPATQAPDSSNVSPKTGEIDDVAPVVAILLLSVSSLAIYKKKKNA